MRSGAVQRLADQQPVRKAPKKEPSAEAMGQAEASPEATFSEARERTVKALAELDGLMRKPEGGYGEGVRTPAQVAADAADLAEEGHEWSRMAGLGFVLPSAALTCRPLGCNEGADGLLPSESGGPVIPTLPGLLVAPAWPCGHGLFATASLKKGAQLGEYTGQVRSYDVWVEEIKARKRRARGPDAGSVPFIVEELYAAWAGEGPRCAGVVIDAFAAGNTMRFINCSCAPSCDFKDFGRSFQGHSRMEVRALRDVEPGEQLSVNYGWYYDPDTNQAIKEQAVLAYNGDRPALQRIAAALAPEGAVDALGDDVSVSDAVLAVAAAAEQARAPTSEPFAPRGFLQRFLDPQKLVAALAEDGGEALRDEAAGVRDIPDALWPLYEVVGADVVGIPCRCGLDPSLNPGGRCSGIIGRPLQAALDGRD